MPRTKRSIQNSDDEEFVVKQPSVKKVKKAKKSPAKKSSSSNAKSNGFSAAKKKETIEKLRERVMKKLYKTGLKSNRSKPYVVIPLGTYKTDEQVLSLTDKLPAPKDSKSFYKWKFDEDTESVSEWLDIPSLFRVLYFGSVYAPIGMHIEPKIEVTLATPLTVTFDKRTRCLSAKLRMQEPADELSL